MRTARFGILLTLTGLAACATASNDGEGGSGGSGGTPATTSSSGVTVSSSSASSSESSSASTTSSSESSSASSSSTGGLTMCGNGMIDPGEQCDGTDFGGKTCQTFGLSGGSLVCNPFCGIVVSACTPAETCTNQADDDQDGSVDCDDSDCATFPGCTDSCAAPLLATIPGFVFGDITGRPDTLSSSCMPQAGREVVYDFTSAVDEDVVVNLSFADFDGGIAIRTACGDATSEIACVNANVGGSEAATFHAVAGQTYFVIVESVNDQPGFYDVDIEDIQPESFCTNLVDDDFDGYTDCDDATACQGSFDCMPGTGALGTSCFSNTDCAANAGDPICLPDFDGWPNGYCSEFCNLAANDCPGDGQCVQLGISTNGVCLDGCTTINDCQPGYACVDEGLPMKVCDRPPEVNCGDDNDNDNDGFVDCEDTTSCTSSPMCVPGAGAAGTPCQLHTDCAANANDPFCVDQFNFGWPGGYCAEFCDLAADDCPTGSACSDWLPFNSGNGLCLHLCSGPNDCRPGYSCINDGTHNICVH